MTPHARPATRWLPRALAGTRLSGAWQFVVALSLANAPFWLIGHFVFMNRALVNVDIALAIIVMARHRTLGGVLLALAWCADGAVSQSLTFHFGSPLDFLRSVRYIGTLELSRYVDLAHAALLLPFLVAAGLLVWGIRRAANIVRPGLTITAVLVVADALNGSSMLSLGATWQVPVNLAGSPASALVSLQMVQQVHKPLRAIPPAESVRGLVDVEQWARAHPERSVVFIVVESMGAPMAPALRQWLDGQLVDADLRRRYDVQATDAPFHGSTTSAEMRALCLMEGRFQDIDAASGATCLPSRLAAMGWQTVGLHGFSERMFDRQTWWPLIGIRDMQLGESDMVKGMPRCGAAFRGACDRSIVAAAFARAKTSSSFVYALTLNTHLPLERLPLLADAGTACRRADVSDDACALLSALGTTLRGIRAELDATPSPLVIVVGDHAPPFAGRTARGSFAEGRVPAFALIPRETPAVPK